MTLNPAFKDLFERWRDKAQEYSGEDTPDLFDKFFSLYVAYNALYSEAAAYLSRKAMSENKKAYTKISDRAAATTYVLNLLGSKSLMESLEEAEPTKQAVDNLREILDQTKYPRFWIYLDPITGKPLEDKNKKIVNNLNSSSTNKCATEILQIIYQVRCNMFHGRKDVAAVQKELLIPLITILEKLSDVLYEKLKSVPFIDASKLEISPS